MATVGIPVLVWEDHHGGFTAVALDWGRWSVPAAYDRTRAGAMDQLKDFLRWQFGMHWRPSVDLLDPEAFFLRLRIRPEYRDARRGRPSPCGEAVTIRVPCVRGKTSGGALCCAIPTFRLGFTCRDASELRTMAAEKVRQALAGQTPRQLSRMLPPKEMAIERILVKARPPRSLTSPARVRLAVLPQVAEPIGEAGFRKSFSAAYQREREVVQLAERLQSEKGSLLLVGEDGAGKSTLLVNAVRAAERKASSEGPMPHASGARHRFWRSSAARLLAGMRYLGQWQERCEEVIGELARIGGVLCVESLIDLVRRGGDDPSAGLAAFLLPYMQSGQLRIVAEATPAEFDAAARLLPGIAQIFEVVRVEELSRRAACEALEQLAAARARDLRLEPQGPVAPAAVRLFLRFLPYHPLPGKAAVFLRHLFDRADRDRALRLDEALVLDRFVRETGLPERLLDDRSPLPAEEVFSALRSAVIGQDEAAMAAARLVCTFKAGLNDPQRPVGSMLFCGPTGVGKTQLARTLANYLFGHGGDTHRLVRLDMSEYSAPWSAPRLLVKPDGTPSDLLSRVRRQPFQVVLFDEIEKADPQVFDLLLGLLDEGRLTDQYGRTTWFRTSIVIMTSNLGARTGSSIGFGDPATDGYLREVRSFFRPEFFNRLDAVVTFRPLDKTICGAVVRKELSELEGREGFRKRGLSVRFTDALVGHLVSEGFDPRYGARPLQRTIERRVVAPLAAFLVSATPPEGTAIEVDFDPARGRVVVETAAP